MPYYSFKVRSSEEVVHPTLLLTIGEGVDVFNRCISDLPGFLQELELLGVEVLEYYQLDNLEAIQPSVFVLSDSIGEPNALPSNSEQHSSET